MGDQNKKHDFAYYTALGTALGVAFGAAFDNVAVGLARY